MRFDPERSICTYIYIYVSELACKNCLIGLCNRLNSLLYLMGIKCFKPVNNVVLSSRLSETYIHVSSRFKYFDFFDLALFAFYSIGF